MDNENMDLICRLCLGDSPDISILDSESSVLQQKILTLVNVEVSKLFYLLLETCYVYSFYILGYNLG